jgi:hypothetical protein
MIYFMNPWPGEGNSIATYSHMVNDGNHRWDYTLSLITLPSEVISVSPTEKELIYPNPSKGLIHISAGITESEISIYNISGQCVYATKTEQGKITNADLTHLPKGIYIVESSIENGARTHTLLELN